MHGFINESFLRSCVLRPGRLAAGAILLAAAFPQAGARAQAPSPTIYGPLGLNTVPSARMEKAGTIRLGVAAMDPYVHGTLAFQLAPPLSIVLRQTAEVSNINADPDRLYPGIDVKLRLFDENEARPALVVGLQSATGHKRMAGEYFALSKRWKSFDFTAGLGWGRYGSAGHFNNPLKALHKHFGKERDIDGEMPNTAADWFTGEKIGLFGGVEYFTPLEGLSLKLDWGADRHEAEKAAFDYNPPAPWSAGISYQATDWANISVAAQGTDKIMARLSLGGLLSGWRDQAADQPPAPHMRRYRTGLTLGQEMANEAARDNQYLHNVKTGERRASATLPLEHGISTPGQIGRAAVHMANHGGPETEEIEIVPTVMGLSGPSVRLMRSDLERVIAQREGSADEIWRNARFTENSDYAREEFRRGRRQEEREVRVQVTLDTQLSLAEEDSGTLYRTALLIGQRAPEFFGLLDSGYEFRINIKDNLDRLTEIRPRAILPVRSDVDVFAERTFALDKLYTAYTHSFRPDLHLALIGGYLEEMYAGAGGEILYRPLGSRFAVGVESWLALKRDPYADLNLGLNGDHLLSGHVNFWYDLPRWDVTLHAKAGRYLAEDLGATLGLQKIFKNGAKLEGFVTVTDMADADLFGGTTHSYHGVRLSLPLGGFKHLPRETAAKIRMEPLGRDTGQSIDSPLPLYGVTEPFSLQHMARHWEEVTP